MRHIVQLLLGVALLGAAACSPDMWEPKPSDNANTQLAMRFAQAMVAGKAPEAHALLSAKLRAELTPEVLAKQYQAMVSYGSGPPTILKVMTTMTDWATKEPADTEWVYVAITNDTYSEAVTVVIAEEDSKLVIRSIEWGRP